MLSVAKGQYKEWLEKDKLLLLQGWKRDGLTDEQIAENIGINVRTLSKWKANYRQIGLALKVGKQQANFIIENTLFKKASQGNTTAMIFWLKNNWRDKYNDSALSIEERQAMSVKARKMKADAEISEFKAQMLKQSNGNGTIKIDVGVGDWNDED